jgi:hypothetical protein
MDAVAGFADEGLCVEKRGPGFAKTLQEVSMSVYAITAVIFLALDAVMLSLVMKPLFTRHLGDTMRDSPLLAPAALFYLAYVAGSCISSRSPRCAIPRTNRPPCTVR